MWANVKQRKKLIPWRQCLAVLSPLSTHDTKENEFSWSSKSFKWAEMKVGSLFFFFFNVLSWVLLDAGRACQEIREPEACRSWLIPMGSGWRETWGSQQPIVQINLGLRWPYVISLCPCHFEPWISLGNLWEMLKTVHLEEGNEYLTRRWEIPQQEMLGVFGR